MNRQHPVRSAIFVILAMVLALGSLTGSQASAQTAGRVDPSTLGMYVGFDRGDRFHRFERELGTPIRYVVTMADSRSPSAMLSSVWGQFAKSDAYLPKVSNRVDVVLSLPLAFGPGGMGLTASGRSTIRQNLLATAAGRLDGEFRAAARYLKEAGFGDAIIRLGHEFDGDWAPYSARGNNDAYIAAFRHVHNVLKSESAAFKVEWTSMDAHFIQYGPPAYPGNAYVDIVGLDIYWRERGTITDFQWNNQMKNVLVAHQAFAVSKGKPVSYPEWGRSLADRTRFIDLMHGWYASLPASGPGSMVYNSYFNEPGLSEDQYWPYDLDRLPNVKRRYIELFGRQAAQVTTPPPTTAPAPTTTYKPAERVTTTSPPAPAPTAPLTTAPPLTTTTTKPAPAPSTGTTASTTSVSGSSTTASISARRAGDTLQVSWSHPAALNYIMRYKPVDSPWWIWGPQSLDNTRTIDIDTSTTYEIEVITNIGGTWRTWNRLLVEPAPTTTAPLQAPAPAPTTSAPAATTPASPAGSSTSASVSGSGTKASINARLVDGTIEVSWSHPAALNYIMRYRPADSPWWIWGPQSLDNTRTVDAGAASGYVIEVITNVLGTWREWQRLAIGAAD